MATCCTAEWTYIRGSIQELQAEVSTTNGTVLDAQVVEMSLDGDTWFTGTWLGTAGTTREVEALVDFGTVYIGTYNVRVKVTDTPSLPIFFVGQVKVVA
jgi:hypothetical protein